jgi:hypothetical protein
MDEQTAGVKARKEAQSEGGGKRRKKGRED